MSTRRLRHFAFPQNSGQGLHENETIYSPTTWTAAGNDHIVIGALTVSGSGVLTIADGCTVLFEHGAYLQAYGTLNVTGTPGGGVLFTRRDPGDEWSGIYYQSGSSGSLAYCTVEHATYYTGYGIYATGSWPAIEHCTIRQNDYGIYATGVEYPTLDVNNTIEDNGIGGVYFYNCTMPSVSNQTITDHVDRGAIYMNGSGEFHIGMGNSVTGNNWGLSMTLDSWPSAASNGNIPMAGNTNDDGVRIDGGSTYSGSTRWRNLGADYIVTAVPTIGGGGELTIDPGCTVRFENGQYLQNYGTLDVLGESGNGILFTRRDPGDQWSGLYFQSGSSGSLAYCTVEHATYYTGYGIYATGSWPAIEHCTIRQNDYGIYATGVDYPTLDVNNTIEDNLIGGVQFYNCTQPSVSNQTITGHVDQGAIYMNATGEFHIGSGNSVTGNVWGLTMNLASWPSASSNGNIPMAGNTNDDGLRVHGGSLHSSDGRWRNLGADYIVTSVPTIGGGGELTIDPGCTVRFENGQYLQNYGTLDALGNWVHGILFTRRHVDDEWSGLYFQSGSGGTVRYATIEHATYYTGYGVYVTGASPAIEHCEIRDNDYGIYANSASPDIVSNTITGNYDYGVYLYAACEPYFGGTLQEGNTILGNGGGESDRDLRNGSERIYARYVWWGSLQRSVIETRIHHEPDDDALGLVIYSPWTDVDHETYHYFYETGVEGEEAEALPEVFQLAQNHPNPFNPVTEIRYALPTDAEVSLDIFDVTGRKVATLVNAFETAGYKSFRWDARDVASGTYFYRLVAGDFVETRKMLLIK